MDSISDMTDEVIAKAVQDGNRDAFGTLIDRYESKLKRYGKKFLANSDDIDDIVQDIFLSAYRSIQSFDTSERWSPWLYRIAHNAFVNALRKQKHRPLSIDFDTLLTFASHEEPVEAEHERAEMKARIDAGMESLAPKYREVLVLHYFEDMAYKDIADVLEVPVGTVGVRLLRAKEALKRSLHTQT